MAQRAVARGARRAGAKRTKSSSLLKFDGEPCLDWYPLIGRCALGIVELLVPDELWEMTQNVLPERPARPQGGGRRRAGDREVLAAIVFVAASRCSWRQLPPVFDVSWQTAHRRFTEWSRSGVWSQLHRAVRNAESCMAGTLEAVTSISGRASREGVTTQSCQPFETSAKTDRILALTQRE
ncbi:hypothetical protein GCM10010441_65080 [Kitasatospora paracochleata]